MGCIRLFLFQNLIKHDRVVRIGDTMFAKQMVQAAPARLSVERLIARHGRGAVVMALIAALLRRPRRKARHRAINIDAMPAHLRRDIGLPPPVHHKNPADWHWWPPNY